MSPRKGVLLTGATGFLGRLLLRELLQAGVRVAVLVRDRQGQKAERRLRDLTDVESPVAARTPAPTLIAGDLQRPGLGLTATDRAWLARNCDSVMHAAACVAFHDSPRGEPHVTNVDGTRRLAELCNAIDISQFHHVSTAFVCGKQSGLVPEGNHPPGPFRNSYEQSKWTAETLLQQYPLLRTTIYRPSVIVGHSQTGETTSYHGFYRFLEMADRLARPGMQSGLRSLPLQLPFSGEETRDLVPVDWVAQAITRIWDRPQFHGRCFHLTSPRPVTVREIKMVVEKELGLTGMTLTAPGSAVPSRKMDLAYRDALRAYWPYFAGDPVFDRTQTMSALPDLPGVAIEGETIARLIRFATSHNWGRTPPVQAHETEIGCADYLERYLPGVIEDSFLSELAVTATLGFDVRGAGGGRWVCEIIEGQIRKVSRDHIAPTEVEYRLDVPTFARVVAGDQSPQAAFFARKIEIAGRVEMGLKLAMLFGQFVRESPYQWDLREEQHATSR